MSTAAITAASGSDITAALTQVSQIEQQLQQLRNGTLISSIDDVGSTSGSGETAAASTDTSAASATSFADALVQAQSGDGTDTDSDTAAVSDSALADELTAADGAGTSSTGLGAYSTAIDQSLPDGGITTTGGASISAGATLPASSSTLLTSSQRQFASTLSADTGLNPSVVVSWLLAEESGSAAQSREAQGNNDWLNLGYTDSGTYGAADSVWSDPVSAANATAGWLKGQNSIPGYGTASSGIQSILGSVGETPQAQITALQQSGWASSGYPDLDSLYTQVTGTSP